MCRTGLRRNPVGPANHTAYETALAVPIGGDWICGIGGDVSGVLKTLGESKVPSHWCEVHHRRTIAQVVAHRDRRRDRGEVGGVGVHDRNGLGVRRPVAGSIHCGPFSENSTGGVGQVQPGEIVCVSDDYGAECVGVRGRGDAGGIRVFGGENAHAEVRGNREHRGRPVKNGHRGRAAVAVAVQVRGPKGNNRVTQPDNRADRRNLGYHGVGRAIVRCHHLPSQVRQRAMRGRIRHDVCVHCTMADDRRNGVQHREGDLDGRALAARIGQGIGPGDSAIVRPRNTGAVRGGNGGCGR